MHNQLKMFPISYYSYKRGRGLGGVVTFLLQQTILAKATIPNEQIFNCLIAIRFVVYL
jgi:hypothetical protein